MFPLLAGKTGRRPNGLLTNLVASWELNESSGNALDSHTNALHLTETSGTIGAAAGPGGVGGSRDFERSDGELFIRPGDDAALSPVDTDFCGEIWVNLESKPAISYICGKYGGAGNREWLLWYNGGGVDRFTFSVSALGSTLVNVQATTFGAPSLATWYRIKFYHDPTANLIGIGVNDGAFNTAAHTTGIFDGTAAFAVGNAADLAAAWDGLIAKCRIWKGSLLTAAQWTTLYNGGAGLPYTSFTA